MTKPFYPTALDTDPSRWLIHGSTENKVPFGSICNSDNGVSELDGYETVVVEAESKMTSSESISNL